ncbi:MAG: sel1 repeat family protein [Candidatus Aureabacteria bacterium]|nr:sel1 repeat family protein [Candidatus Auribacterota bacterium]
MSSRCLTEADYLLYKRRKYPGEVVFPFWFKILPMDEIPVYKILYLGVLNGDHKKEGQLGTQLYFFLKMGCTRNMSDGEDEEFRFEVFYWLIKAAEGGNAKALYYLGRLYESGCIVNKDHDKAFDLYRRIAESREAEAETYLKKLFEKRPLHENWTGPFKCLKSWIRRGSLEARVELAKLYLRNDGLCFRPQSHVRALHLLLEAILLGDEYAWTWLDELIPVYIKSAERFSCGTPGVLHSYQVRIFQEFMKIEESAGQGKAIAQTKMGCLCLRAKRYANGFGWLLKAAGQDDMYAKYALAGLYLTGKGCESSLSKAKCLAEEVVSRGNTLLSGKAKALLEQIKESAFMNESISAVSSKKPGSELKTEGDGDSKPPDFSMEQKEKIKGLLHHFHSGERSRMKRLFSEGVEGDDSGARYELGEAFYHLSAYLKDKGWVAEYVLTDLEDATCLLLNRSASRGFGENIRFTDQGKRVII